MSVSQCAAQPSRSPDASQDAPILGHDVVGQGREKVLVFHDWMGDSANYEPLIRYLDGSAYTYVFADLRGYGRSQNLTGHYSVEEVAADAIRLADEAFSRHWPLDDGQAVQRMAVDDWSSGARRLKSVIAITPMSAGGYPADESVKTFLWDLIHERSLSEQGFSLLTGQRLLPAWARGKTDRHMRTSSEAALKGYYPCGWRRIFREKSARPPSKRHCSSSAEGGTFPASRKSISGGPSEPGIQTRSSRLSPTPATTQCRRPRFIWPASSKGSSALIGERLFVLYGPNGPQRERPIPAGKWRE